MTAKHPMQPIIIASDGVVRFKKNPIVAYLLDHGGIDMNAIAIGIARGAIAATPEDQSQFAQLIGYSVSGFGDLSYAPEEDVAAADAIAERVWAQSKQETV